MKFIYLMVLILITLSCGQQEIVNLDRKDFSISYPKHLILDESGEGGINLILKTSKENDKDVFIESINLIKRNLTGFTFSEIAQKTIEDIESCATIIENKKIKLNGNDCLRIVFELSQQNVDIKIIQHLILSNGKLYLLTFTCEKKNFSKYFNDFNSVLLSFKSVDG